MAKKLEIKKREEGQGQYKLTYFYTICPRCKQEIRAHQKGQVKHNLGMHQLNCGGLDEN